MPYRYRYRETIVHLIRVAIPGFPQISGHQNQDDPIVVAVCRFIADRAQ